jgi:hypothetical protein
VILLIDVVRITVSRKSILNILLRWLSVFDFCFVLIQIENLTTHLSVSWGIFCINSYLVMGSLYGVRNDLLKFYYMILCILVLIFFAIKNTATQ